MEVTRAEAEQRVRAIQRTCRGLPVLPEEKRKALAEEWTVAHNSKDYDAAVLVVRKTEEAVGAGSNPVFDLNDWQTLTNRMHQAVFAYSLNCGADFNDIVVAGPFDGEEHEYTCPKCGQKGTYRAPFFEIVQ